MPACGTSCGCWAAWAAAPAARSVWLPTVEEPEEDEPDDDDEEEPDDDDEEEPEDEEEEEDEDGVLQSAPSQPGVVHVQVTQPSTLFPPLGVPRLLQSEASHAFFVLQSAPSQPVLQTLQRFALLGLQTGVEVAVAGWPLPQVQVFATHCLPLFRWYPLLQLPVAQICAPLLVQSAPVALAPWVQVQSLSAHPAASETAPAMVPYLPA